MAGITFHDPYGHGGGDLPSPAALGFRGAPPPLPPPKKGPPKWGPSAQHAGLFSKEACAHITLCCFSREKYIPPPLPLFLAKGIFQGRGVGVYILSPHSAGILYAPPLLYAPPPLEGYFQGGGCKIRPCSFASPEIQEELSRIVDIFRRFFRDDF